MRLRISNTSRAHPPAVLNSATVQPTAGTVSHTGFNTTQSHTSKPARVACPHTPAPSCALPSRSEPFPSSALLLLNPVAASPVHKDRHLCSSPSRERGGAHRVYIPSALLWTRPSVVRGVTWMVCALPTVTPLAPRSSTEHLSLCSRATRTISEVAQTPQ